LCSFGGSEAKKVKFDLHIHSSYSDGQFQPEEIILQAKEISLDGISLTDHDSVGGIEEAKTAAIKKDIGFISGIELSTTFEDNDEIHILGYGIDHKSSALVDKLNFLFQSRQKRAEGIIRRLNEMGINVTLEKVKHLTKGGLIGRPHLAQAIAEAGYSSSPQEAFQNYLKQNSPAYVPREKLKIEDGVELIHCAGGIAVIAHPALIKEKLLFSLLNTKLIDGLEVYYPLHTKQQVQNFLQLCYNNNLVITGGSDFHGLKVKSTQLGQSSVTEKEWEKLKERIEETNAKNKITFQSKTP